MALQGRTIMLKKNLNFYKSTFLVLFSRSSMYTSLRSMEGKNQINEGIFACALHENQNRF